jgi:2,3-bisphosphoglycerate-dependent phosphoglycerate mutase
MIRGLATSSSSSSSSSRRLCDLRRVATRRRSASPQANDEEDATIAGNNTAVATLVLLRHGQSTWNEAPAIFSGWCDPPLTQRGLAEATEAGRLLRSRGFLHFDKVYTSNLQRAVKTCELVLEAVVSDTKNKKPMVITNRAWQLNERHYGALQGLYKDDPALLEKYGKEQLLSWRRDFLAAPPPILDADESQNAYYQPPPAPRTESLQDCQDRVLQYWNNVILPALVPGSQNLLVAHANTIRALVSYLDEVPHDQIPKLHIPNSVPCIYQLNATTGRAISPLLDSRAGGTRGQWLFSAENYSRLKQKIGASSSFVRSIFEAWDTNGDGLLSRHEIGDGLRKIIKDSLDDDVALAGLAAKILEQVDMNGSGTLDVQEFDAFAVAAFQKFVPALVD